MKLELPKLGIRRLANHASIYATGNILRQVAGFLMLPIYTRYLTPSDYGVIGLITFAMSIISIIIGPPLNVAVPMYYFNEKDKKAQAMVVSNALVISCSLNAITTVSLAVMRNSFTEILFGDSGNATIVALFSFTIFSQPIEEYGMLYLRIQQRPWFYIGLNLSKLVLQLSLNIWLVVVLELGVTGIAIGALASSSIFAFLLWVTVLWPVGVYLNLEVARKLFKLSWPLWVAAFAALYIGSANRYYLRIFGSMEDIGLFELATKFSGIVSLLIWQPFAQYWHIERYKCYQQVGAKLVFQDAFRFISTVLTVGALGVGIFGGPVIHIMSEEAFHGASGSVPFLAFGTAFYCLSEFSNFSFVIKEKTIWISRITYLTGGMITVLYLIFIPWLGHVGAALAFMLAQGIMFLTVQCVGRQFYDMGIKMKQLAMMLIVAGGAIWLSNGIVILEGLIEDIAVKTIIYLSACVIICLPLWKNFGGQVIFENFLNRFSRMVRLKKE